MVAPMILPKSKRTHFIRNVKFPSSVKVEDGVEGTRMSVKKELIVHKRVISTKTQDLVVGSSPAIIISFNDMSSIFSLWDFSEPMESLEMHFYF